MRAELRQFFRGRHTRRDVALERHELRLAPGHVGSHRHLVVVEEKAARGDGQRNERADLRVPRKLRERQFHVDVLPSRIEANHTTVNAVYRPGFAPAAGG